MSYKDPESYPDPDPDPDPDFYGFMNFTWILPSGVYKFVCPCVFVFLEYIIDKALYHFVVGYLI